MPIYEYRCNHCHKQHEHLCKINEVSEQVCPNCGSQDYQRLLSAPIVTKTQSQPKPICPSTGNVCQGCHAH